MPTFLQLCARLTQRSGVIGAAPSTVTGQSGRQARCVDWIENAWELIQTSNPDWTFLRSTWSHALTINQTAYAAADLGITDRFGAWRGDRKASLSLYRPTTIYDSTIGVADERPLRQLPFEAWLESFDRGAQVANRPVYYCIAPDQTIRFGPKPDKAYVCRGEYRKGPQILAADSDVPDMPADYHDLIVYRAMLLIDEDDEAPTPPGIARARIRHNELLFTLQRECLPKISSRGDGPLA